MTAQRKDLASVCEVIMGQAPSGDSYNDSGQGYPLVAGAGDFGPGFPSVKKHTTEASKLSREGDIILGIRASIGAKVISDKEYCLGRGVAGLRPGPKLEGRYLWHWLDDVRDELLSKGRGATFLQVNRNDIRELQIPLPPLAEQKRIAGILDAADALRAKRRESLAQLDSLLQSTFLTLFGDPVSNPMGWEVAAMGDQLNVIGGFAFKSEDFADEGVPVVRISNLNRDSIDLDDCARIPRAKVGKGEKFRIHPGDTLIAMSGATTGKLGFVPDDLTDDWFLNQRVGAFRIPSDSLLHREYLRALLASPFYQQHVLNLAGGAAQPNISGKQLESAVIPLPPLPLQRRFAAIVESVERQKARQRAHLAELDALFASLQHRAFRGEL